MSGIEKLMHIQTKIKAPKNLYNSFGKYNYRNAECILEAVKPYLLEENCALSITDDVVDVGGRIYLKASVSLIDCKDGTSISTSFGFARESDTKKGMDESQITGTASSYARKYALNGLFLLDDTKDADTDEYKMQTEGKKSEKKSDEAEMDAKSKEVAKQKISEVKVNALKARCDEDGVSVEKLCSAYKVKSLDDVTEAQLSNMNAHWEKIKTM